MNTTSEAATYDDHVAWVKKRPDHYKVVAFRGRGTYERHQRNRLADARKIALAMVEDRPVLIYAVRGVHSIVTESVSKKGEA